MAGLEPIEEMLRDESLDDDTLLVVRGWPLTVDGLLGNADATRHRFSRSGAPFSAVSAEVAVGEWTLETILFRPRLRTRSRYAAVSMQALADARFELLPTFLAPHYSITLKPYTAERAERLLEVFGDVLTNPYYVKRAQ